MTGPHNEALLEKNGEGLGAGNVKRNDMTFFTAYIKLSIEASLLYQN